MIEYLIISIIAVSMAVAIKIIIVRRERKRYCRDLKNIFMIDLEKLNEEENHE